MIALKYALAIVFIYSCFQDGMILAGLRRMIDHFITSDMLKKPLYDCMVCMSGLYTCIFCAIDGLPLSFDIVWLIAVVGGINVVLSPFVEQTIFSIQKRMTDG